MHGLLQARLELIGGRTLVTRQMTRHPLRLSAPRGKADSAAALLYVGMVAGGILEGDRLEIGLELGRGARALVTTSSASKILSMGAGSASQQIAFDLDDGATLEYLPDEVIPFAGSSFSQEICVRMAPTARLVLTELLTPGRAGLGERFAFRSYLSRLRVRRGGRLVLHDVADLMPAEMVFGNVGLLADYSHYGSLVALAPEAGTALADEVDEALRGSEETVGSASAAPEVVVARILGHSTQSVKQALSEAWRVVHTQTLGQPPETIPGKIRF